MKCFSIKHSGFTLIELLVSITIIGIISVMSISAYPKFSEQMAVTSQVYKILAFSMETKIYGVASYSDPGTKLAYAFLIEKNNDTVKRVLIKNPVDDTNRYYVDNFVDETDRNLGNLTINKNYTISDICYYGTDKTNCDQKIDKVYGIFRRPNPDARLIGLVGTVISPDISTGRYDRVEITLESKKNKDLSKKIVVLSTGQIYVK